VQRLLQWFLEGPLCGNHLYRATRSTRTHVSARVQYCTWLGTLLVATSYMQVTGAAYFEVHLQSRIDAGLYEDGRHIRGPSASNTAAQVHVRTSPVGSLKERWTNPSPTMRTTHRPGAAIGAQWWAPTVPPHTHTHTVVVLL
jgi:hypothetical protein